MNSQILLNLQTADEYRSEDYLSKDFFLIMYSSLSNTIDFQLWNEHFLASEISQKNT